MVLALTILICLTGALVVFSLLEAPLRAAGWPRRRLLEKLDLKSRLEHALDPLSKAMLLSPTEVSRTRRWLIQAGCRDARHLTIYKGSRLVCAFLGLLAVIATCGLQS